MQNSIFNLYFCSSKKEKPLDDNSKYIVFGGCLRLLLALCAVCGDNACDVTVRKKLGTAALFVSRCRDCHRTREWTSQPQTNRLSLGNLMLSASIFFSGASPKKSVNLLKFMGVMVFSMRSYFIYQRSYLVPAVCRVWQRHRERMVAAARALGGLLHLAGDARCDSPGHNAKYATYSLMDMGNTTIHNVVLVQVNVIIIKA